MQNDFFWVLILICSEIKDGFKQSVFPEGEVKPALELDIGGAHDSKCQNTKISGLSLFSVLYYCKLNIFLF